jgi:nucleoside-diphosphate-sugar epimerase
MKVLVTGGTGFLGRRTVERLAKEHEVRLLVRSSSSRERFPPNVEFAVGDVTDAASLAPAVQGCEAVVHAAALVKILAPREEFDRVNVGGLENVLAAAKAGGVSRMVYVSSFIALGPTEWRAASVECSTRAPASRRIRRVVGSTTTSAPRPCPTAARAAPSSRAPR